MLALSLRQVTKVRQVKQAFARQDGNKVHQFAGSGQRMPLSAFDHVARPVGAGPVSSLSHEGWSRADATGDYRR